MIALPGPATGESQFRRKCRSSTLPLLPTELPETIELRQAITPNRYHVRWEMAILERNMYRLPRIELTDDSLLWRYIDFPKYVSLLLKKTLFFCKVAKFNDPYEGMLTRHDYAKIREIDPSSDERMIRQWLDNVRSQTSVNCWHLGDEESAAMWSLYGLKNQSIAITSSFSRMAAELPVYVGIGAVEYIDFDTAQQYFTERFGEDKLVLWKRPSFQHEREVRFLISDTTRALTGLAALDLVGAGDGSGFFVPIDPEKIIASVYVDPTAPWWFYKLVEEISKKNGLDNVVRRSDLWLEPDYS